MARSPDHDTSRIYRLVERWRDGCLIEDGSLLFPGEHLWAPEVIGELYRRYNENPLDADGDTRGFEEKFREQLGSDRQDVTRLGAEVLVVYFLFAVIAVNGPRKRELISEVLSWGEDQFDEDSDVAHVLDAGIGNPGQGYNNLRWKHIAYFVAFARRFKDLDGERRSSLVRDPWEFKAWLIEEDEGEQMGRHLLLHLLFPDSYERIASTAHKYRIRDAFAALLANPADDVDRALFEIRERIVELMPQGQPSIPGQIDFYWPPLWEGWDPDDSGGDADAALTHLGALEFKRQVVLYGPPGTGKTYEAKQLAARLITHQALVRWGPVAFLENTERIEQAIKDQVRRVQLHQAWSYEQFIGGLKLAEGGATELQEGYLPELVNEIERVGGEGEPPPLPWVLILDELNRTDLSRLLGEVFSALDDREAPIDLAGLGDEQQRRTLKLPKDLFIVGTLNLIDQSVEALDFALRRRFLWLYTGFRTEIIPEVVERKWNELGIAHHPFDRLREDIDLLAERASQLNTEIRDSHLLGEQYEIGHTYLFDVVGFIERWPKVRRQGYRPPRYLWKDDKPLPPAVDLWRFSLKPLLDEYLAGIEPDQRNRQVARLRDVFLNGK
jgi:5-methylcytosine-specific restriction protein B